MKFRHILVALVLLSGTAAAQAEDYPHKASGLQFSLPKGWSATEKGGRLTIQNKDKSVSLVGGVIEKTAAKLILGNIDKFLSKIDGFGEAKVVDGPTKEEVNGLEQAWYEGTTKIKAGRRTMQASYFAPRSAAFASYVRRPALPPTLSSAI